MSNRGVQTGKNLWSKKSQDTLRANWGTAGTTAESIGKLLTPVRSPDAVVCQAHRMKLVLLETASEKSARMRASREAKRAAEGKKPMKTAPKRLPAPQAPLSEEDRAFREEMRWAPGDPQLWPWRRSELPNVG